MTDIFPLTINGLRIAGDSEPMKPPLRSSYEIGMWVAVRPCDPKLENRTFLGVLLGDMALAISTTLDDAGNLVLEMSHHNPAMWVPKLRRIVLGCGSWWHPLTSPDQLTEITDKDIHDTWYVQALRELSGQPGDVTAWHRIDGVTEAS